VFKDMVKANEELQGMERVGRNRKNKFIKFLIKLFGCGTKMIRLQKILTILKR